MITLLQLLIDSFSIIFGVYQFSLYSFWVISSYLWNCRAASKCHGLSFDSVGEIISLFLNQNLPKLFSSFLYDGVYLGVTTVLTFIPVIIIFFIVMSFIENSGYLSRAGFVMDKIMEKMGLDGRSFVMILFGFGCNVPALMSTKIMRSKTNPISNHVNNSFFTLFSKASSICYFYSYLF